MNLTQDTEKNLSRLSHSELYTIIQVKQDMLPHLSELKNRAVGKLVEAETLYEFKERVKSTEIREQQPGIKATVLKDIIGADKDLFEERKVIDQLKHKAELAKSAYEVVIHQLNAAKALYKGDIPLVQNIEFNERRKNVTG